MDPDTQHDFNCRLNALQIAEKNHDDADSMIEDAEKFYLFLCGRPQVSTEDSDIDRG